MYNHLLLLELSYVELVCCVVRIVVHIGMRHGACLKLFISFVSTTTSVVFEAHHI
jgi:hypothetical protein